MVTRSSKLACSIVSVGVVIAVLGLAVSPAAALNIRLRIDPAAPAECSPAGTTVTVSIEAQDFPVGGVKTGQFLIAYPDACLDFVSLVKPAGTPWDNPDTPAVEGEIAPATVNPVNPGGVSVIRWGIGAPPPLFTPYPTSPLVPPDQWVVLGVITFTVNGCCSNGVIEFTDVLPLKTYFMKADNSELIPNKTGAPLPKLDTDLPAVEAQPASFAVDVTGESCNGVMPAYCASLVPTGACTNWASCEQLAPYAPGTVVPIPGCSTTVNVDFKLKDGCNNEITVTRPVTFNKKSPPKVTWVPIEIAVDSDCVMFIPNLCADPRVTIQKCEVGGGCSQAVSTGAMRGDGAYMEDLDHDGQADDVVLLNTCERVIEVVLTVTDGCGLVTSPKIPVKFMANRPVSINIPQQDWTKVTNCQPVWPDLRQYVVLNSCAVGTPVITQNPAPGDGLTPPAGKNACTGFTKKVNFTITSCGITTNHNNIDVTFKDTSPPDTPGLETPEVAAMLNQTVGKDCVMTIPDLCANAQASDCSGVASCQQYPPPGTQLMEPASCSQAIGIAVVICDGCGNCKTVNKTATYTASTAEPTLPEISAEQRTFDVASCAAKVIIPDLCTHIDGLPGTDIGNNCGAWACTQPDDPAGKEVTWSDNGASTSDGVMEYNVKVVLSSICPTPRSVNKTYKLLFTDLTGPTLTTKFTVNPSYLDNVVAVPGTTYTIYPKPGDSSRVVRRPITSATDNCAPTTVPDNKMDVYYSTDLTDPPGSWTSWPKDNAGTSGVREDDLTFPARTEPYWVRARATDTHGNTTTQIFKFVVVNKNLLQVKLQLQPIVPPVLPPPLLAQWRAVKCVELNLCTSSSTLLATQETWSFPSVETPAGSGYWVTRVDKIYEVDPANYKKMNARAKLHSLTRCVDVTKGTTLETPAREAWVADFTGDPSSPANIKWLLLGNLDGRNAAGQDFCDITDYTLLAIQYINGLNAACNPGNCGVVCVNADPNADGQVTGADLAYIVSNFLVIGDTCCTGAVPMMARTPTLGPKGNARTNALATEDLPRASMSVKELQAMGIVDAAVADRNGDGVVDQTDMQLLTGKAPEKVGKPSMKAAVRKK